MRGDNTGWRVKGIGYRDKKIQITNFHKGYKLNKRFLKRIVSHILNFCKPLKKIELEIIFLTDDGIKVLNRKYKGRNEPTDVLSFDLDMVGEIFISLDRAFANSKSFGTVFTDEVALYMIHGILHLAGYDDKAARARRRMSARENEVLEYLCTKEDLSKVLMPR